VTLVLDCRGQRCPLPVIVLARRIADLTPGELVRVDADDPAAPNDIAAWCRMRGHTYLGVESQPDGVPGILVERVG
jgi:tRNA 2-thiouridine synthesizing protein A